MYSMSLRTAEHMRYALCANAIEMGLYKCVCVFARDFATCAHFQFTTRVFSRNINTTHFIDGTSRILLPLEVSINAQCSFIISMWGEKEPNLMQSSSIYLTSVCSVQGEWAIISNLSTGTYIWNRRKTYLRLTYPQRPPSTRIIC